MDGAAARGRLDLLHWLNTTRTEGCSAKAFTDAAANGHLDALQWLCGVYPHLFDRVRELTTAASHGHVPIVAFLRSGIIADHMVEPALTAAAAKGHVDVVESLLPGSGDMTRPLLAAAQNGHPAVVQLFFERCPLHSIQHALDSAALFGCTDIVVKILDRGNLSDLQVATALDSAAAHGDCDLIKLLLEKWPMQLWKNSRPDNAEVERALGRSVHSGQVKVTKILLQRLPQDAPSFLATGKTTPSMAFSSQRMINNAFYSAAENGNAAMARLLAGRISDRFVDALVAAATNNQVAVLTELLEVSKEGGVGQKALQQVLTQGEVDTLLLEKCDPDTFAAIFTEAAAKGRTTLLQLMLDKVKTATLKFALANCY